MLRIDVVWRPQERDSDDIRENVALVQMRIGDN
jgi:hypothetical protein